MASIVLNNVRKNFGDVEVIRDVNIDIPDGSFTVFVGPSGCGKSTLLRLIAGLEEITEGDLYIDEQRVNELEPKERGVAMVFQSYAIFPHMTVFENIAFGLTIRRESKSEISRKVNSAAQLLQLEPLLQRRPAQLSGGQRQRVAIGRAIVRDPSVFLFDEPLSNLDAALRMNTRQEIATLHNKLNATMIYVTHDQVEAMTLANQIVVLKDGRVMQAGAPIELYHHPANKFVAGFLGAPSMNFIDVVVEQNDGRTVTVSGPLTQPITISANTSYTVGQSVTLGVRPQYLRLVEPNDGQLQGSVVLSERLGTETVVDIQLAGNETIIAALPEDLQLSRGQNVGLYFDPVNVHLFDSD